MHEHDRAREKRWSNYGMRLRHNDSKQKRETKVKSRRNKSRAQRTNPEADINHLPKQTPKQTGALRII